MSPAREPATRKPRLLVVSNYNAVGPSRPEAEVYLALRERGYDITVVTHGDSAYVRRFRESGMKVLYGHPVGRRDEPARAVIRGELTGGQPYDVLVLYNSRAIANGVRAAKGIDVTVVAYRGYTGDLRWYDPSVYLKLYHPRVDAILCNNAGVRRHIQRNRWWAARDITHVVYKGHDLAWYADVEPLDKTALGIPADAPLVVCVANAAKFKGVRYLLAAMARLDRRLGAHLVLCGHNMDTPAHRRLARAVPHPERIHFPGYRDDVLRIVAAADVKVLPSIYGESLTKAAFEAMAVGTPVLITDIPGNEELVEHDVSGVKVPPRAPDALARALERVLSDEGFRQNLSRAARDRLRGLLSHRRTVDEMDAFFLGLQAFRTQSSAR